MYYLFWGGPFSNFYPRDIVIRGTTFNCCEQYFMAAKASLFGDREIALKIMEADHPAKQKRLGREVKGFCPIAWDAVSRDVMFRANWAKYTQHSDLQWQLEQTRDAGPLVEASPHDRIWGIGLAADDPRAMNKSQWLGRNWLGEVLTEIRDGIRLTGAAESV